MTKIEQWQRRHAIQIAAALPDDVTDALQVLELARELVAGFLAGPEAKPKAATIVPIKMAP